MSTGGDSGQINLGSLTLDGSQLQAVMLQAGKVLVNFAQQIERSMQQSAPRVTALQRTFQSLGASLQKTGQQVAQAMNRINQSAQVAVAGVQNLSKAAGGIAAAAGAGSVALIKLASDANEAASKFGFVFGTAADRTGKKLDEFAKAAGRSRYAMRDMASNIGALLGPMGFTSQKTGELSTQFAKLAVDLSSFFNVTEGDALMALRSGIVGESEPLRRFGVQLNEAKIQAEAFKLGLAKTKDQVTGAVKAQAILSIVMRETQQAQGDAIRTGDQFANSLRRMKDFAKDAATDLGQALIPAATKLIRAMGDLAEPVKNWAKANQEVLAQRVSQVMDSAVAAGARLVKAFESGWQVVHKLGGALSALGGKASGLFAEVQAIWQTMPKWAQDAILVASSLLAVGSGLDFIGSRIPFIGGLASSLGTVVNPLTLIKGLIAFIGPVLATVFSPIGVAVAAASAAVYGLYKAFQKSYDESEEFRLTWERVKDKLSDIWDGIKGAAGRAMDWVGDKISDLSGGAFKSLGDVGRAVVEGLLDAFERLLDWFNGDGKGLQSIGISIAKAWNNAMASILESIASVIDSASQMLYGPVGKMLAKVDKDFADLYMYYAGQNTSRLTDSLKGAAAGLRNKNAGLDQEQQDIEGQRNQEKQARNEQIERRKKNDRFAETAAKGRGGQAQAEQQLWEQIGAAEEAGRVKWDQANAAAKAQADQQVQAAQTEAAADTAAAKPADEGPRFTHGTGTAAGNLRVLTANNRAMLQQAAGMRGAQGGAAKQAAAMITRLGEIIIEGIANKNLSSEQQGVVIDLEKTYRDLVTQFKAGTLTQQEFQKQVKAAADQAQKLAGAEKQLTDAEVAALNAKGIFTPQQQQAMQAAQQQAQQQVQQVIQKLQDQFKPNIDSAAQIFGNPGGAGLQGGQDVAEIVQQAKEAGDPAKAIDILRTYFEAQVAQTKINLQNTFGGDPVLQSFGGAFAGMAQGNMQYLLSQPGQAQDTIKMFQGLIERLNAIKIPKMAVGGIVSSPTTALIGEAGPEAVIPLSRLAQMFGNPANIFPANGQFRFDPGAMQFNPFGITAGRLGLFDQRFNLAGSILSRQMDLGNLGAGGILGRWGQAQQALEDSLSYASRRRSIDLGGNAGWANGAGPGDTNLHFSFGDIHVSGANSPAEIAANLFDAFEAEARRRGHDASGRRAFSYSTNGRSSPLTPAGQAR